jgi:DNA-binding response OmpR family regulator
MTNVRLTARQAATRNVGVAVAPDVTPDGGGVGERVLVIDDDAKLARLVARALTLAGFSVSTALNGLRGLALAQDDGVKLVILDLVLPDVDGLSILGQIRERHPARQILVLSALSDVHSKVRCLEVGACDYMTKPFDLPELVARVRLRAHKASEAVEERFLESDGYKLDRRKRCVTSASGTSTLSTREYVLLEYLMRHRERTCTRDELLEYVWGYTFDPVTNILDVYIARLRQKLGFECIQTARNVGYAFVGE